MTDGATGATALLCPLRFPSPMKMGETYSDHGLHPALSPPLCSKRIEKWPFLPVWPAILHAFSIERRGVLLSAQAHVVSQSCKRRGIGKPSAEKRGCFCPKCYLSHSETIWNPSYRTPSCSWVFSITGTNTNVNALSVAWFGLYLNDQDRKNRIPRSYRENYWISMLDCFIDIEEITLIIFSS